MTDIVLLTRHKKATWIAPPLKSAGYEVVEFPDYDTDQLGTFCNTKPRELDGKQTAAKKARLASKLSKHRYGLGSEGSFTQQLVSGFTWEQEILCFYDQHTDTEVFAYSEGPAGVTRFDAANFDELKTMAERIDQQRWMWQEANGQWHKGLDTAQLFKVLNDKEAPFPVTVIPDYRALHCPSRQNLIALAAEDLAKKLTQTCPECHTPGFTYTQKLSGLPCEVCKLPTQQAMGWWAECSECGHKEFLKSQDEFASVQHCSFCNP